MRESRESDAVISVVNDDPSVRLGLQRLIGSIGWEPKPSPSQELLARASSRYNYGQVAVSTQRRPHRALIRVSLSMPPG
jgi:FixJ family two-component response regulator